MSNPIKSSDLFIDDGSLQLFIDKAKELEAAVESLKKEAAKLAVQIRKNNNANTQQGNNLKQSATRANELKKAYDNYNKAIAKNATYIQSIKTATREQNQLNKNSAKLAKNVATSYNQLSAQYSLNKAKLNAMSVAQRENTKEGRILVKQTRDIYTEMKRLQAQTGKNSLDVGNYGKAVNGLWKSFKNLAAVYLSFTGLKNIFASVFGTTKELDALDLSYRKVISSSSELAQTNEFLAGVSDRLGIGILDARKSYLKFRAAAGSTNLSVKQTQKIFESFSKASSILSLSGDDTRGVFKALEQIISKGKVSSEELRLQLGERLPGAFSIMAKSLNVSVSQLDAMLKKGEVLSEDALPKFAAEVEKAFGVENLERIDTLAAAQGRLSTAWVELVDALDTESVFGTVLNFFTSFVNVIQRNLGLIINLTKGLVVAAAAFGTYRTALLLTTAAQQLGLKSTISYTSAKRAYVVATNLASTATKIFTNVLRTNPFALVASLLIGIVTALALFNKESEKSVDLLDDISDNATKAISKEKAQAELLIKVLKSENNTREGKISALNELKRINPDYFGDLKVEKGQVEGLTESYEAYIQSIQNAAELKGTTEKIQSISTELDEVDEKIKRLEKVKVDRNKPGQLGGTFGTGEAQRKSQLAAAKARQQELRDDKALLFQKGQNLINANAVNEEAADKDYDYKKLTSKKLRQLLKSDILGEREAAKEELDIRKKNNDKYIELVKKRNKAAFDERKRRIDEMEGGEEKELATLQLSLDKKLVTYKQNGEATEALLVYYENRKKEITDKYKNEAKLKELDEAKERLDLRESSEEQEIALIKNAAERKILDGKDRVLVEKETARKIAAVQRKYADKEEAERERIIAELIKAEEDKFKLEEDLLRAKFLAEKRSTDEIAQYNLDAKVRELEQLKLIQETFNKDLTDDELKLIKQRIANAKAAALDGVDAGTDGKKEGQSLYDLLGFSLDDKEEAAINTAVSTALDQLKNVQQAKLEAANQNVQTANTEVATAQRTLNAEIANRNAGFAHSVDTAQKEFDEAKKNQDRAKKERDKAQKDQRRIDTLTQTSSLITAAAGIWKNIGTSNPFLALGAIALMFGSFAAAKIKANNITKKTLGKGGYEKIGGGSHASGNDTFVGKNSSNEQVYAERGETMGVFRKKSVRQYGSRIKDLVNSINSGTLDNHLLGLNKASDGIPVFNLSNSNNTDMSTTESELRKIRRQGESRTGIDQQGRKFEQRKNILTTYIQ